MKLKDSGVRQEFPSGAVRDSRDGKGRFDLICPYALEQLALQLERGCAKYGERQWEQGMPQSRFYDSAVRHLSQFAKGLVDEDHLLAAFWNLHCLVSQRERMAANLLPQSLDDMPAGVALHDNRQLIERVDAMSGIPDVLLGKFPTANWGASLIEQQHDDKYFSTRNAVGNNKLADIVAKQRLADIVAKHSEVFYVADSELLHRDVGACLNLCDDVHGEAKGCNKDFACGDPRCADHLIAKVNSREL